MIQKARSKFVLGATAATCAAVLILVFAINLVHYMQVRRQQEETLLTEVVKTAAEAVEFYVSDGIYEAQNKFNGTINP